MKIIMTFIQTLLTPNPDGSFDIFETKKKNGFVCLNPILPVDVNALNELLQVEAPHLKASHLTPVKYGDKHMIFVGKPTPRKESDLSSYFNV